MVAQQRMLLICLPTMQFIEGTGDDNDVFVAYDLAFSENTDDGVQHGIEAIEVTRYLIWTLVKIHYHWQQTEESLFTLRPV